MHHPPADHDDLFKGGLRQLRDLLGEGWSAVPERAPAPPGADYVLQLCPPDGSPPTNVLIEVKRHVTPRLVRDVLSQTTELHRRLDDTATTLLIAPWLSPRTRAALHEAGIGFLDLTGNVSLHMSRPAIVVHTEGAARDPGSRPASGRTTLAGPRAGRLVRVLADHEPPYRAARIAEQARLSLPWVSKLLGLLEDELLIQRDGRIITEVDWTGLIRARAATFDLLRSNSYVGLLAPNGVEPVHNALRGLANPESSDEPVVITGSHAARAVAPVAVGGQLMLYVKAGPHGPDRLADELGLIRVEEGADVLVLRAYDDVVFQRPRLVDGEYHVALSQLALDCLAGPGRLPAEGEAVLRHMADTVPDWRSALPLSR